MPGRGSLGRHAERCSREPWPGSGFRAVWPAPALWRFAHPGREPHGVIAPSPPFTRGRCLGEPPQLPGAGATAPAAVRCQRPAPATGRPARHPAPRSAHAATTTSACARAIGPRQAPTASPTRSRHHAPRARQRPSSARRGTDSAATCDVPLARPRGRRHDGRPLGPGSGFHSARPGVGCQEVDRGFTMDGQRFDAITKAWVGGGASRRQILRGLAGGLAGAGFTAVGAGNGRAAPNQCAAFCDQLFDEGPGQATCRQVCGGCAGGVARLCLATTNGVPTGVSCCSGNQTCCGEVCCTPQRCCVVSPTEQQCCAQEETCTGPRGCLRIRV
jgi:hypothetical protein